jgi:single-stranded-DNA-specific exonuclease
MAVTTWAEAGGWQERAAEITSLYGLPAVTAMLLSKGAREPDSLDAFLHPDDIPWPDPARIPNLMKAAERISRALRDDEQILVHGDYDVDGLMGSAVLVGGLRSLGGRVEAFIPSRFDGGYGLSDTSLEAVTETRSSLVITTDCGTNAREIGDRLSSSGVELIVTDHHLPVRDQQPDGIVVNPHLKDGHPDRMLCGASVALQVLRGVAEVMGKALPLEPFLRLTAIATVTDVVPMTPLNRKICKAGFKALRDTPNTGLAHMLNQAKVTGPVRGYHISFHIGPRFNAAGRMEDARLVLDLLLERRPERAAALMGRLEMLNRRRKSLQAVALEEALVQARGNGNPRVAFAASTNWHKGVIGPVAARLADSLHKSAFVVSIEDGEGVGSARSWKDDNVSSLLDGASDLLVRYGGHSGAAGFTVKEDRIDTLASRLAEAPSAANGDEARETYFPIGPEDLTAAWDAWGYLDPFGPGHPEPYLGVTGLVPRGQRIAAGRHIIWDTAMPGGDTLQVIAWDGVATGFDHARLTPSRTVIGRPGPQNRAGSLPFYFNVEAIL